MLEVQRFLRGGGTLSSLNAAHGINVAEHLTDPLVILNYDQIASRPKDHPVVRECRGLVLEKGSWNVVARSFPRFFNAGECPADDAAFDWPSFTARDKCDGSLVLLYKYGVNWRVNTRGSFAQGEIADGVGKTWEQVFWGAGIDANAVDPPDGGLSYGWTYVFELCGPFNKVVRRYERPTLYLLTAFRNATGEEARDWNLDYMADFLGVCRPLHVPAGGLADLQVLLERHEDPTYEGVVVRDRNGLRLKVKNPRYVALHRMRGEGDNLYSAKNLLPFVLKGEEAELLAYFPEVKGRLDAVRSVVLAELYNILGVWEAAKDLLTQKEFALYVLPRTGLAAVLFEARKGNGTPEEIFRRSGDLLLKWLAKNRAG